MNIVYWKYGYLLLALTTSLSVIGQELSNTKIEELITTYKSDIRGPYKDIRWFCADGTVIPPKESCGEQGGVQRARYRPEVEALAEGQHIFLGQILSNTDFDAFWDDGRQQSRLKQYQLEKYLRAINDGWILRKAQYYRGAYQIEDELQWGSDFFDHVLKQNQVTKGHYFLLRQAASDIQHNTNSIQTDQIRILSKTLSDDFPKFIDLRSKIHGQPDLSDIEKVIAFKAEYDSKLSESLKVQFDRLITEMKDVYGNRDLASIKPLLKGIGSTNKLTSSYNELVADHLNSPMSAAKSKAIVDVLWEAKTILPELKSAKMKLAALDFSLALENVLFRDIGQWTPNGLKEQLQKSYYLASAAAACGYMEDWEWKSTGAIESIINKNSTTLEELIEAHQVTNRWVEWSSSMITTQYEEVVETFTGFEPLAQGFVDDRIRRSIILPLGAVVAALGDAIAVEAGYSNNVLDLSAQSELRGLNPGFAFGELVVVEGSSENIEVSTDKIYIFNKPSSDLKPVAGIATVSEGNAVSHVQLLARNLGIPNAVLSIGNMQSLKKYHGQKIFYAVSNSGTVIMKLEREMSGEEKALFESRQRSEERIRVPTEQLQLGLNTILDLRAVDASSSGKLCGPKAANLGQLKLLFPEQVVDGLVIPFGVFNSHMNQLMTGSNKSYAYFIYEIFLQVRIMRDDECEESEIDAYVFPELDILRKEIMRMEFIPGFQDSLRMEFQSVLGSTMGKLPVFLRSDTNMEDLKDFTGAGLNLTLFNVVDDEKIFKGIKEVWASPFTERSYRWRHRFLLNPENVFPSILIIPTVDVDKSGVLITKGLINSNSDDLTVAFSRGAGGAVDGQKAESYLIKNNGDAVLLSPSREPYYRKLPVNGGSLKVPATFDQPILSNTNLDQIRTIATELKKQLSENDTYESKGPYDVELGFKDDQLWLFQVRPFVENKNAKTALYLESITPVIDKSKTISLN